ncbi:MAG: hypothetical protein DWQ37_09935 [Planctomycetota bacterium]|nr:MAG: hypothetical protein DWQ37_09935 [Planctomycetota bacterium]
MGRAVVIVLGCVLGLGLLFYENDSTSPGGAPAASEPGRAAGPEARRWLKGNESESALASNRFGPTDEALRFVNELYRAGATRVVVPSDAISDDGVERYADALVVELPSNPDKRSRVLAICERELRRQGLDPDDGDQVYLWWD